MLLMQTVQDETMAVAGFERHTFMCSSCHDVENRLTFAKPAEQPTLAAAPAATMPVHMMSAQVAPADVAPTDVVPLHIAPPISPTTRGHEQVSAPGMFRRVLSKLRGG
ncbi:MAG TPA: hypothetical protein VKD43_07080 [Xanthobacteraceae bacterium]|nr:hypothetical protein [Xanthobacteraceae bacterium]